MSERIDNVLFLCTGNTARSILAEGILREEGRGNFHADTAGSFPKGTVNPPALKVLESYDCPTDTMRSKSWREIALPGATVMDFVFTVCDQAADEFCPSIDRVTLGPKLHEIGQGEGSTFDRLQAS